jgi:hypothetical protein
VRQQLSEEEVRIRTRLLCILLTVLFLARQHIALRKLPFVAKLVHSFGSIVLAKNAKCQEIKFTAGLPGLRRNGGGSGAGRGRGGEREREKEEGNEADLRSPFWAKSRGYSAFQDILPDLTPKTNRCASRFATTASALRASAAVRGAKARLFSAALCSPHCLRLTA